MSKFHKNRENKDISKENLDNDFPMEEIADENKDSDTDASEKTGTDNLAEQLEAEKQKNGELKDSYLRLMAEYDNYRKRTLKEKTEMLKSAGENVLSGLLPIIDDFERGLDIMRKSDNMEANLEGVELIYNKFMSFLNSQGVKPIETEGKEFDTEHYEAVTTIPAPSPELKGKIIDCIQKGYTLNDKVIRFAKVVVGE